MDPGELTPFGLAVEFLQDGRALLRIGATLIALSPHQVAELRKQLGVGTVTVENESGHALAWESRSSPTLRPGGRNYTLTIRAAPGQPPPPLSLVEALTTNVKRLKKPRKDKEKP